MTDRYNSVTERYGNFASSVIKKTFLRYMVRL